MHLRMGLKIIVISATPLQVNSYENQNTRQNRILKPFNEKRKLQISKN